jgi:hypothetical protein
MPATHLLYRHDDGRWVRARIVQQIRSGADQRWRVLVTYTTAPGFTYTRGEWADCELLRPDPEHDDRHQVAEARGQAEREYEAAEEGSLVRRHRGTA